VHLTYFYCLCYLSAKDYQIWWRFDEVLTKKLGRFLAHPVRACIYTVFRKKNTHSRFLLYFCGKCLDLHKIFRECLPENKYSENGKVRYSLLPMMSC